MKTINIKNIAWLFIALVSFSGVVSSCGKESDKVMMSLNKKPGFSINSQKDLTIDLGSTETGSLDISWTDADFGTPLGVTYSLNIKTLDPQKSEDITLTKKNKESISYEELKKTIIGKMQLPAGKTYDVYLSIVAKPTREGVSETDNKIVFPSDVIKVKVVLPANASLVPPGFSFVGSMFDGGKSWDIAYHGYKFFRDNESDNIHKYVGKFKAGSEFKIVPEEGFDGWNHLIGKKDGALTWEGGETNIKDITNSGYYQLVFDPKAFTLTITPYDASTKPVFEFIGLIGTAVGSWDNDVLLTKAAYDEHIWVKENVTLSAGELKIRANKDWNTNWGVSTLTYGTAVPGASNFAIPVDKAGNYNVYFNDLIGWYIFEKINN